MAVSRSSSVITTFLLALGGLAHGKEPATVREELQALAGPSALHCGSLEVLAAARNALKCARKATRSGSAFWVAFQRQGTDSLVWEGAAADRSGRLWALFYDSDASGGSGEFTPLLGVSRCSTLRFSSRAPRVRCTEMDNEP